MTEISINTENIKLDQLLKFGAIAQTGGESKYYITEGMVKVNGEVCLQRGKKIKAGDKVEVENVGSFLVVKE